jgi:aconitate hydratase
MFENYYRAQSLWGTPEKGQIDYSVSLELDLSTVAPGVAGPKRPQDRIDLNKLKAEFTKAFSKPLAENGFGKSADELTKQFRIDCNGNGNPGGGSQEPVSRRAAEARNTNPTTELEMANNRPTPDPVQPSIPAFCGGHLQHGSVLIAAITSCTNTSNPSVMLAAGLLAKKAIEHGLYLNPMVKASLAPGSRVVTDYLNKTGLQPYLDQLGFNLVGYGCTTCIGNSGPLASQIEDTVIRNDVIAAAVLSGNRNFEARVHQSIRANFLMSPPLVVAFALAGNVNIDMAHEPSGQGKSGPFYRRDRCPPHEEFPRALKTPRKHEE